MNTVSTGSLIKALRIEQNLTQAQLAEQLNVSDKTVSKWERDRGLPDISLLASIAETLQVDIEKLLSGILSAENTEGGNMKRVAFYVCPTCGEILTTTSKADISCCGRKLSALTPQPTDEAHRLRVIDSGHNCYVTFPHEMTKDHFISFIARATFDTVLIKRLYPEQGSETYLPKLYGGKIYSYCPQHGLTVDNYQEHTD